MSMTSDKVIGDFISQIVAEGKIDVVTAQKKIVFDVFSGVVKKTPVDTGRARSGWQIDVGGTESQTIGNIPPYSVVYIINNVEYIVVIDQGGYVPPDPEDTPDANKRRASRRDQKTRARAQAIAGDPGAPLVKSGYTLQAPHGMVDLTLNEIASGLLG